jgi:hypothetical protein
MFSKSADVFPFAKNLAQNALENIFQKSVEVGITFISTHSPQRSTGEFHTPGKSCCQVAV